MASAMRVNPTRMELTRIKKRLVTARRGHKLLKDKRDEMVRRFTALVRENASLRREVESELSGGLKQRAALVRTMALEPDILLLDEPFSALDYQTRLAVSADIYSIIRQEHKTALLVTHDISESISMSDRVVVLSQRPATVRAIHNLTDLQALPPMERRDHPAFRSYFNAIWKELDVHE